MSDADLWSDACAQHRGRIWGLAYRMTGSAADADDIAQETLAQLVHKRPEASRDLAPWLVRVCVNLARDRLRQRKRQEARYIGCWLPEPAADLGETSGELAWVTRESASFAFLVALEALTPLQRAVLLLRDVFDLDTRETARALDLTEGSVRATLHRARTTLQGRRLEERPPQADLHRAAMSQLFLALMSGDIAQVQALLTEEVRSYQDAGGVYSASTRIVTGARRVAQLLLGINAIYANSPPPHIEELHLNGTLALMVSRPPPYPNPRSAPRALILLSTDDQGAIDAIFSLTHPQKLSRL